MLRLTFLITLFMCVLPFVFGCSSNQGNPLLPSEERTEISLPVNLVDESQTNRSMLGSWMITFYLADMTAEAANFRDLDVHFNITQMIPPPGILINSYDPVTGIVNVDFTISNPFVFTGYDVRLIVHTDDIGHLLLNPDDWTELFDGPSGMQINPFRAFAKEEANRVFNGETEHMENLDIYLPGGNPIVTIAIDASYPGNCEEPYEINDFMQDTLYSDLGSSAHAQVTVKDWQNDVNSVELYCPAVIGPTLVQLSQVDTETWEMTLENTEGAPEGDYIAMI